jgi:PAS domain S-box-containing protein
MSQSETTAPGTPRLAGDRDEALRDSQDRFRLLADNALDIIFRYALRPAPRLEYISPAVTAITGYTPEEHYADPEMERRLVHPDDLHLVQAADPPPPEGRTFEVRMIRKDGRVIWTEHRNRSVLDAEGRPAAIEGLVRDVTVRKDAQLRLLSAERLAGLGRLSAGVAHEVNNPLAWIASNLHFAEEALAASAGAGPGPAALAEVRQALAEAREGVARVRAIVAGLQKFAPSAMATDRRPFEVVAELRAALAITRSLLEARAELVLELAEGLPPVLAGEAELGQVFVNLLTRAAGATAAGPPSAQRVTVAARAQDGRLVVEVRDTGEALPAEALTHAFDPFFAAHPGAPGQGLALAVCHGIVTALGGSISIESRAGQGTVVRVVLPAATPARPAPAAAVAVTPVGTVLVVDDEPLVGRSLVRILERRHRVTALTSAREVLERVEAGERWDVVICDLMMPQMTGMALARRLREVAPDLLPRLVFSTGGAFTEQARAFLDEGWPVLQKPIEPQALRDWVDAAVRARQGASSR